MCARTKVHFSYIAFHLLIYVYAIRLPLRPHPTISLGIVRRASVVWLVYRWIIICLYACRGMIYGYNFVCFCTQKAIKLFNIRFCSMYCTHILFSIGLWVSWPLEEHKPASGTPPLTLTLNINVANFAVSPIDGIANSNDALGWSHQFVWLPLHFRACWKSMPDKMGACGARRADYLIQFRCIAKLPTKKRKIWHKLHFELSKGMRCVTTNTANATTRSDMRWHAVWRNGWNNLNSLLHCSRREITNNKHICPGMAHGGSLLFAWHHFRFSFPSNARFHKHIFNAGIILCI